MEQSATKSGDSGSLGCWAAIGVILGCVASFQTAFEVGMVAPLGVVTFATLLGVIVRWGSRRQCFYGGLLIGTALGSIQLTFMAKTFGSAAFLLWMVLGIWMAVFLVAANHTLHCFPRLGILLLPILWVGVEFFRSELYYLRFSWVTPSLSLSETPWQGLLGLGQYTSGGLMMACGFYLISFRQLAGAMMAMLFLVLPLLHPAVFTPRSTAPSAPSSRPVILAGIQLEWPDQSELTSHLDRLVETVPDADVLVLSEYTLSGAVPDQVLRWCDQQDRYLILGGKDSVDDDTFYNTAFVIGPNGKIVHRQAKSVPIQFFHDGLPAKEQTLWQSPFGKIGLAVCYDLSYHQVIDPLITKGAQIIINPTMDPEYWGRSEHELHARIPIVRATEYGIPIARLASSGVSIFADQQGRVIGRGDFPGQGEIVVARLDLATNPRYPIDRLIAPACVIGTLLILGASIMPRSRASAPPHTV